MENKVNIPSENFEKELNELTSCLYNKAEQRGDEFAKDIHIEFGETKDFTFDRNLFVKDFENTIVELNLYFTFEDIPKKIRKRIEKKYWGCVFSTATDILEKPIQEKEFARYWYSIHLPYGSKNITMSIECVKCYNYYNYLINEKSKRI